MRNDACVILLFLSCFLANALVVIQGYTIPSSNNNNNNNNNHNKGFKPSFLKRQDMCGIWKLSQTEDMRQQQKQLSPNDKIAETNSGGEHYLDDDPTSVIVLRLNEDGTFDPYTSEAATTKQQPKKLHQWLARGGCWEYKDQSLLLAADRPPQGTQKMPDTVLNGRLQVQFSENIEEAPSPLIDEEEEQQHKSNDNNSNNDTPTSNTPPLLDVHLSIPQGQISQGKFFYPKKHKAFFDQPMLFQPNQTGTFAMQQVLGNLNARLQQEKLATNNKPVAKFHKRDFYNRTFYLTDTPHPVNEGYAARDLYYDETKATLDLRVMPLTFYPNNTFAVVGVEKILRGRYGIMGDQRDKLWFQVSLFGAGRSAPGSVYSEGRLLSQDDRRGYIGPIQAYPGRHNRTTLFVDGEYYYGSDLKRARKPNSMGTFTLQEMDEEEEDDNDDDDEDSNNAIWDDVEDAFQ